MNKILFLVHTEYHLLISSKIILDNYNNDDFVIEIILGKTVGKSRLKDNYDFSSFANVTVNEVYYDEFDRTPNKALQDLVARLLKTKYQRFFFFQEHHPVPVYLAYQLHKKGAIVCLGPDGAKAYNRISRIAPRWSTLAFIWYHRFLIANGFYFWNKPWPSLRYASFRCIDEVWMMYTDKYLNWNNKKLIEIKSDFDHEVLCKLKSVFNFSGSGVHHRENVIFFINQNFGDKRLEDFEIDFLKKLHANHHDKKIIIKMHPNTIEDHKRKISNISNVIILSENIPAELYIMNLVNSLVVSFWSTSNLTYNSSCRYYWVYPLIIERGLMIKYFHLSDPTDYIVHVHKVEDIQ